ncbi:MAG: bifunctional phosphoribosylaminoimidazolecarboxamide formyltransferase/IMP cyclohydrolase [Magnetococcales bacterium]|nr:bifunctional phosphoribosylaminoimidazolecarboxamide formyltransferase/IMP cyclohydrolase [Magnetococcales bacterium]
MAIIKRALISVSDKKGVVDFCRALSGMGVVLLSTGGTASLLKQNDIPVTDVSSHTGFPEMLDGRVKTLHPLIHGGLLGLRDNPDHQQQMQQHGIVAIDLVAITLYPFVQTVAQPDCSFDHAVENIDIGGPSMIRSAAKNHRSVTVVTDPADYQRIIAEMQRNHGEVSLQTNSELARKAFAVTAAYDGAIANWLSSFDDNGQKMRFPGSYTMQFHKVQEMRYGENPHQLAAFYTEGQGGTEPSVANARQLQGKELSFNNIHDANGAFELVKEFDAPTAVIVKHTNPCGVASHDDLLAAYNQARATDPVSAFGGVIAFNRTVTALVAREITTSFVEAVIAPGFDTDALMIFGEKKNIRLLHTPELGQGRPEAALDMKRVIGGLLLQERDLHQLDRQQLQLVTRRAPTEEELADLLFAWRVVKHVKSNAIVYAKGLCTVGVGAGQMSRVDSSRIAIWKAQEAAHNAGRSDNPVQGSVMASDAFFPFRDGVDAAAQAGATALIQPGGSVRDSEVIAAADEQGMAMVLTGVRHFKH